MDTATCMPAGVTSSALWADLSSPPSVSAQNAPRTNVARASTYRVRGLTVFPGNLREGWQLITPLELTLDIEDGNYILSDDVFLVYGVGATIGEAFEDYILSLIELCQLTEASAEQNPHDRPLLARLRRYLKRRA